MTQHTATIVVVEDEAPIAAAIAARLRSEGFRVEVAPDGRTALELCRRVRPDLMVLDLMLPEMDGLEVCRRVLAGPGRDARSRSSCSPPATTRPTCWSGSAWAPTTT
jgi:CheY-like chemotaxis protein